LHELNKATENRLAGNLETENCHLPHVKLGIFEGDPNLSPVKFIRTHIFLSLSSAAPHHLSLLGVEKPSLPRIVGQTKPDGKSTNNTEYAFDDIYPPINVSLGASIREVVSLPPAS
jgi:hypothetical protein